MQKEAQKRNEVISNVEKNHSVDNDLTKNKNKNNSNQNKNKNKFKKDKTEKKDQKINSTAHFDKKI